MFRGPCLFIRSPVQFTCFGTVMLTDLMAPTPLTDNLYCKTVPTEPDKLYLLNPVGTSQVQFCGPTSQVQFCGPSFNDVRATMNTKLIEPVCFPIFTVRGHFSSTGYSPHFTDFLVLLVLTRVRIFTRSPPRLPRRLPRRFPVAAPLPCPGVRSMASMLQPCLDRQIIQPCLDMQIIQQPVTGRQQQNLFGLIGDMTMVDVQGDGNCLFRALAYHVRRLERFWKLKGWQFPERVHVHGHAYDLPKGDLHALFVCGPTGNFHALCACLFLLLMCHDPPDHVGWRSVVCRWIDNHRDFWSDDQIRNYVTGGDRELTAEQFVHDRNYGLANNGVWAGDSILHIAAAFLHQVPIPSCRCHDPDCPHVDCHATVGVWLFAPDEVKFKLRLPINPEPWEHSRDPQDAQLSTHLKPLGDRGGARGVNSEIPVWDIALVNHPPNVHFQAAVPNTTSLFVPEQLPPLVRSTRLTPRFLEDFTNIHTNHQGTARTGPVELSQSVNILSNIVEEDELEDISKWLLVGFSEQAVHTQMPELLETCWGQQETRDCRLLMEQNWQRSPAEGALQAWSGLTNTWTAVGRSTVQSMLDKAKTLPHQDRGMERLEFGLGPDREHMTVHSDHLLRGSFKPLEWFESRHSGNTTLCLAGPNLMRNVKTEIQEAFKQASGCLTSAQMVAERLVFVTGKSPSSQVVRCHYDELQNISVCLVGEKMWFLLAPWDAPPAQAGNAHANELRDVTPRSHPHLPWVVVHQRAGHILLLPAGWFHYVLSHKEGSCCATFWLPAASKGMDNTQHDLASVDIWNSPRIADGEFDAILQTLDIAPTQDALVNVPITTGACCPPQTR